MRRLSIAVMVLALGAAVVLSTGCGNVAEKVATEVAERATEKIVEKETGGKVKIDAGGADMTDLPPFLHYPGVKATDKVSVTTAEGKGTVWSLETTDLIGNVVDWYRAAFETNGWKVISEMETGESTMLMGGLEDKKETVTLLLVWGEDKTTISLTHARK